MNSEKVKGKKLKLQWVTDVIGADFKNWKNGDTVAIQAQPATGKTFLITGGIVNGKKIPGIIDRMSDTENLIYICNRVELKRQVKIDLCKIFNIELPTDKEGKLNTEKLDLLEYIGNVRITSYHKIAEGVKNHLYDGKIYDCLEKYSYIVCDEIHFILTDASFNNMTRFIYEEIITNRYMNSIKILITATMDEIKPIIEKSIENLKETGLGTYKKIELHDYTTGIDYSYLDVKYFKYIKDIITTIKNDKSEDKWLIFVTNKSKGEEILNDLTAAEIGCDFIYSTDSQKKKSEQAENITLHSKFTCKVLIATKVLDNGVNIKDPEVKNIVVMAYDKTTFIQEIGRIRFKIDDAPMINLYIRTCSRATFETLKYEYDIKANQVNLLIDDKNEFNKTYDNKLSELDDTLFYRDRNTKEININKLGYARLIKDNSFAMTMIEKFHSDKNFAYIKEQLSWLELSHTFSEENLIIDVMEDDTMDLLREFLKKAYEENEKFTKEYFLNKMDEILCEDKTMRIALNKLDGGNARSKGQKLYNKLFKEGMNLSYRVGSQVIKETIDGKRKNITYWVITSEDN